MNFYIGSCRYMTKDIEHFPARLHTTKEIIYFLENIENINELIKLHNNELINIIFGDLFNPAIIDDANIFLNTKINIKIIQNLFLEISSRNIYYYKNDIPVNAYYTNDDLI